MKSTEELPSAARSILSRCEGKRIFAFLGEMGSGKTTMIKELCRQIGVTEKVVSPTFAIVNEYKGEAPVYHMDLYRLETLEEALAIGIEEYLSPETYCFIEWAERIEKILPDDAVTIHITVAEDNHRILKISGC